MSRVLLVSGALLCFGSLLGCGGPPDAARAVSVASASAVDAAADALDYRARAARALDEAAQAGESFAQYEERMELYGAVLDAINTARHAVNALQAVIIGWDEAAEENWIAAAACVAAALSEVGQSLQAAQIALPEALRQAIGMAGDIGGSCVND